MIQLLATGVLKHLILQIKWQLTLRFGQYFCVMRGRGGVLKWRVLVLGNKCLMIHIYTGNDHMLWNNIAGILIEQHVRADVAVVSLWHKAWVAQWFTVKGYGL